MILLGDGRPETLARRISLAGLSLLAIGLVVGWSVRASPLGEGDGDASAERLLLESGARAALGILAFLVAARMNPERLRAFAPAFFGLTLALLALVLVPGLGQQMGGARRWFRAGGIGFQPSEIAKLAIVLFLADRLARRSGEGFRSFRPGLAGVAALTVLVLLEPDVGTTAFLLATAGALLLLGGLPWRAAILGLAAPAGLGVLLFALVPDTFAHVWKRLESFTGETSYQVRESIVALGSGGIGGLGLGASRQKLGYLPEGSRDFIYSLLGEELGLVGSLGVLALFSLLVFWGVSSARAAKDPFLALLAHGIAFGIGLQAAIHMGVATGLLPPKGIPLPFLSTGGSSLVLSLGELGLLARAALERDGSTGVPVASGPKGPDPRRFLAWDSSRSTAFSR